ncbi:MAG: hypothetical protein ONB50_15730 [candidate division KSB1 bacterium]|nr:hypothetical protein [candidate division KSB1 bacterium]MDZ7299413.1 hypothetical protein [candidate division KSB1 bacterium]
MNGQASCNPSKQLLLALICGFAAMTTVADAQEGNCFGTPSATVSGPNIRPSLPATISVGVILVEFTDRLHFTRTPDLPNGYLKLHFENMLFSDDFYYTTPNSVTSPDGEDVYGSVKDWYQENSHGLIQITGQVVNPANGRGVLTWLNLGSSATYLNNTYLMITTAIAQAVSNNWNCNYNIICVIASQDLNGQSENTWHGSANFGGPSDYRIPSTALPSGSPLFNYNNFMGCYNTFERARGVSTGTPTFRHVGVHVHEIFHTLGLVFLGNWSDQTGVNFTHYATGDWSTMHRTDIGPKRKGECESHLLAARKVSVGWANATDITSNNMAENIQYINTQIDIPNATDFYRFTDNASGEQFVVENRQYTGFNSFLPGWWDPNAVKGGLLIFNTKPYATIGCNDRSIERLRWADNSLTTSYTVGSSDPTLIFSVGDPGDPFPGSNNNTNFSIATTPNSARRDPAPTNCSTPTPTTIGGDPTGFAITNISASVTTMTATFHSSYLASNSVDATASNSSRKIVRDSGGVYHLVYETTGEIYYQKSTDGGSTWGSYKRLSAGNGSSKFPCIAERSGKLFVVWQRNTGTNTYDVLLRHFNGSSWDTNIRTVQSAISSSSPPTPVIAINMPTDPTPEMVVVYRTGSSIKSRRSTSANGSVWEAEKNVTSNTSARNPSLVYRLDNEVPTHKFHVTWDQGSDIYHQSFNGSLNTWTAAADISTDPFASNNQYSSYAIAGNNDRHVVWQALESEVYFHQAIYHSKNLGNAMAMLVSNSYDQLRPSITGHAGSAATALCYDNSAGQNIRKRRYNGTSWEGAALGTIIASNGADASLSIANPPGATALGVWRSAGSAPYALTVGPSGGLSKSSSEEDLLYHRRIAYFLNDSTKLMLQIDGFEMIEDGNKKSLAFSNVAKDSLPAVDLAATMSVTDMLLSPSADSLAFSLHLLSRDAGQLRDNTNLALLAAFEVSSAETGLALANIALPPIAVVGESKQNARLVFPLQALRGQKINLALKLSNLNVAKVNGTLVHVYELAETGAQKPAQEEEALVAETCRPAFAVKIHPNPFNPSTQIHFSSG